MDFDEWQADARKRAEAVARETGWDLPNRWAIGPVGQSRDSDALEESNFQVTCAAFAEIAPDAGTWEILRFGHWAVGWVEEIAFRMGSDVAREAYAIAQQLEDYSILDEEHFSALEWETDHPTDGECYSDYCKQNEGYCSANPTLCLECGNGTKYHNVGDFERCDTCDYEGYEIRQIDGQLSLTE